jgi:uncharacterized membrane protein YphA (DoxX/SURF4 family)
MNGRKIGYWVATSLVAFMMIPGGILQVMRNPENVEGFTRLGYPVYFMVMLGVWKLLGGVAVLVPRFPRLKEWAYAGIFFDLSSATVTNAVRDGSVGHILAPIVGIAILAASWALRPESRTLGTLFPAKA